MKLLIVEDEYRVRERIALGIPWEAHGIEVAGAVENGREAIAAMREAHIDIVVTDIHMPDVGGLELAKLMKRDHAHAKVIILTGYDQFEYARESIDQGVFKYLVKPAENELILDTVLNAKRLREQELYDRHNLSQLERRWKEHLPRLKELFYKNWLNGRYAGWELAKRSEEIGFALQGRTLLSAVVDMDPTAGNDARFPPDERALLQFALFNIAKDVLAEADEEDAAFEAIALQDDDGLTAVIFIASSAAGGEALRQLADQQLGKLLSTVKDCLKLTASAGIGAEVTDPALLPVAYKQCRMALQERIVLGRETIIRYRHDVPADASWLNMNDMEKEIEIAIDTGSEGRRAALIAALMEKGFSPGRQLADAKEMLLRITALLTRIVHAHGWSLRETLGADYEDFMNFNQLLTKEQVTTWLERMMARIGRSVAERRRSGTHVTVGEIMAYVEAHLGEEELSLYTVAAKLYINYSYASRIIKEVTGSSFSESVLRLRMEKAKALLAGGAKVYEAAEQVGYKHVNYFSKNFQKYWGIKPSDIQA
ncbi:response regulator [Cohnella ginsengisoli]|uniref:Response regulator n=1 Tax=Cohnella ginsengisoli TaxID=425004 RepID=A0A9X4QNK7_9BACL|nr:response regulator [Cohnella ginsengisoli]MDG0792711.1 response regulator [Cohnella ginsengisoli]